MAAKKSARTARREAARAFEKLARQREKLIALEPGGGPDRPIDVVTASVIEPHARGVPCARCGGALRIDEHAAEEHDAGRLRVVRARCVQCGAPRVVWFRIVQPN